MQRVRRVVLAAAALAVVAGSLPGCVFALGSDFDASGARIEALERRMDEAERRLGIGTEAAK